MPKSVLRYAICLLLIFALLVGMQFPAYSQCSEEHIKTAITKGLSYLAASQNGDGGFPSKRGQNSSVTMTQWAVMALRAAGEDLTGSKWTKNGKNPVDYLNNTAVSLQTTTDYALALLSTTAAGIGDTLNGHKLADKIISFQQPNGQFAQPEQGESELINAHIWSIIALASAEKEIPEKSKAIKWLLEVQNPDGGYGWYIGGGSDPDDTGVALNALLILGEDPDTSRAISRAVSYLRKQVNNDGGMRWPGQKSNTASDAWCIQGLVAIGEDPDSSSWQVDGNTLVSHLLNLQGSDGSFQWIKGVASTPVLMTSYALIALTGTPFPVNIDYSQRTKKPARIVMAIDSNKALVNGKQIILDISPKIINNRTMVPLRFISESLGAEVTWNGDKQVIHIRQADKYLSLVVGEISPGLDTPTIIQNERTLVPLRFVSERLGAEVYWREEKREVEIIKK